MDDTMSAFLAGKMDNGNCNNNGGGYGWSGMWEWFPMLIIAGLVFGGGWGFGGFGGGFGGGGAGLQGMATRADINEGFALNGITSGIQAIPQGICDSTYALNNAITGGFAGAQQSMTQGFHGVERSFGDLSRQLSDCCCENRAAIAQVRYDMANQTRDVIEAGNANTRAILDYLTQDKISTLTAENQTLRFQASQAAQNSYLAALSDAQTAELIRRINPTPVPSYQVPAPYPYCGQQYNAGCGCLA